jgi:hypothetical protein
MSNEMREALIAIKEMAETCHCELGENWHDIVRISDGAIAHHQAESEPVGEVSNNKHCGGILWVALTDATAPSFPLGTKFYTGPQPAAQVPEEWKLTIGEAINLATVLDDGGDGADGESARRIVSLLKGLLTAAPSPMEKDKDKTIKNLYTHIGELEETLVKLMRDIKLMREYKDFSEGDEDHRIWVWQDDGSDDLPSLVNDSPVLIRADQLRNLLRRGNEK